MFALKTVFGLRAAMCALTFAFAAALAPQSGAQQPAAPAAAPAAPAQPTQTAPAQAAPAQAAPAPAAAAATPAPPTLPPEVLDPIKRLSESIESAEKSIQQLKELESELQRVRTDVESIIYKFDRRR